MNGPIDGRTVGPTDSRKNKGQTGRSMNVRADGQMEEWDEERANERIDGRTEGWTEG